MFALEVVGLLVLFAMVKLTLFITSHTFIIKNLRDVYVDREYWKMA